MPQATLGASISPQKVRSLLLRMAMTICWLRWQDGEELVALFVEPQTRNWVAWTPSGYYMASPGGERLIGWHLNRGWTQEGSLSRIPVSRTVQSS